MLDGTAKATPASSLDENASALVLVAAAGKMAHGIANVARGMREIDLGKVNLSRGQARGVFHFGTMRQAVFDATALVAVLAATSAGAYHRVVASGRRLGPIAEIGGAVRGGVALLATAEAYQILGPSRGNLSIATIVSDLRVLGPAFLLGHLGFGGSLVLSPRSVLVLFLGFSFAASRRHSA